MLSDPIAALSTAPGRAALAVIRVSGRGALDVAGRVVRGFQPTPARQTRLARFLDETGGEIDRGLYVVYLGPQSYTGEDLVELSCHGGVAVATALLTALHAAGARPAAPGEFTRRAVLNGKLDLIQAEAVGDLIDATAPIQARAAVHQLEGGLSRRLAALREDLLGALALLSYDIDFPEEDDGPLPPERVTARLAELRDRLEALLATAPAGERLRAGALMVLAGRPNAGKSSLFNALLGADRAIVTETPGTTRDAIEAATEFGGWPVRLVDTAGLHASDHPIERLGIEVSHRYLASADLVLLCVEAGRALDPDERRLAESAGCPVLVARTKADLAGDGGGDGEGVAVSSVTGAGLDAIRREAVARVFAAGQPQARLEPALTRERHRLALARARDAVVLAVGEAGPRGDAVLAAHHLQEAARVLEELVGTVDVEAVLDRLFASFCVGK